MSLENVELISPTYFSALPLPVCSFCVHFGNNPEAKQPRSLLWSSPLASPTGPKINTCLYYCMLARLSHRRKILEKGFEVLFIWAREVWKNHHFPEWDRQGWLSFFSISQIALLKILLAAAPTSKAKTDSINILADVLPEEMPWVLPLGQLLDTSVLSSGPLSPHTVVTGIVLREISPFLHVPPVSCRAFYLLSSL